MKRNLPSQKQSIRSSFIKLNSFWCSSDGPFLGAHPAADVHPLEGRPRRAGRGKELPLSRQDHLVVRPDVDEQDVVHAGNLQN